MNENNSKLLGGIGEKKSNGGTQWYLQDRIYSSDIANSIATSFNPNYAIGGAVWKIAN